MTSKPTAIIDKSLFHEICKLPLAEHDCIWRLLLDKYQVIVPFILIEEILVNAINPGAIPKQEAQTMVADVLQLRSWWMDDVLEYSFCELVLKKPINNFIAPSDELQQELLKLLASNFDEPEVIKWADGRKADRKATAQRWKNEQQRITPSCGFYTVKSEREFFERVVKVEFLKILKNPARKSELLEMILGDRFRLRHPESSNEIDKAFTDYNERNFSLSGITLSCLLLRIAYILAPAFRIQTSMNAAASIIISPKTQHQFNNSFDEQYVICAQLCDRLLTMDRGMKNIAEVFREIGFWKGQTIFFDSKKTLSAQIPSILV